ncbi:uncharacterized protein CLUP02_07844 [Colletotrichum lupini]|uniref:Uncharacterized protein n=1 Tax=Colletotrichum lupini TaxID=145971 RepID=A0A9Q8WGG3_9PEZI|nr:uncharacterized protein CLUP02_07844 [Colletotrichum lupini]UQC82356.1 hypothetical protein CLUP02_07844 [Colletotrichum lupini]
MESTGSIEKSDRLQSVQQTYIALSDNAGAYSKKIDVALPENHTPEAAEAAADGAPNTLRSNTEKTCISSREQPQQ